MNEQWRGQESGEEYAVSLKTAATDRLMTRVARAEVVVMTVDEYETLRLIDLEGYNQEECAEQMKIARTTVQGIYTDARRKLADSLVNGKVLIIEGGEYRLCETLDQPCGRGSCRRHHGPHNMFK